LDTSWDSSWNEYYVCSATVVTSATHDILATAGHCVWDNAGGGDFAPYVLFVPGDKDDSETAPWGGWIGSKTFLRNEFMDDALVSANGAPTGDGWAYDYAFVRLEPNKEGKKIQDVVGGQGLAFGIPAETLTVTGYPNGAPFDGKTERYCASTTWERYQMGGYSIDCAMTAGASGGGWFTRWDPERGAGYLVATSSTRSARLLSANAFGKSAYDLFTYAGGVEDGLFFGGDGT
jgi:V8-like Glu-specific endopeptidase